MPNENFAFVSFVTQTTVGTGGGDRFSYVKVLNTDFQISGGGGTTNVYNSTVYNSTVMSNETYRSNVWSLQGVVIQSNTPGAGVQYSQWLLGANGCWGWIRIP